MSQRDNKEAEAGTTNSGRADNRLKVPSIHSERWAIGGISILLILSAYTWVSSTGADVHIQTNAQGALVRLDSMANSSVGGKASFRNVPFGRRHVQVEHIDYEPMTRYFEHGWFSDPNFTMTLSPRPVQLVVQTAPNAEVSVDGVSLGRANGNGYFQSSNITLGSHQVAVRQPGFLDWSREYEVHAPELRVSAYLEINPERQRQIEMNRQKVNELLRTAQQQFLSRKFSDALSTVTDALKLDPNNRDAAGLRDRIEQTMKILK